MHPVLEKIESVADALVPPALVVILVIVVAELFFTETAHHYSGLLSLADTVVVAIFVVDLSFKFHRATRWEGFLKHHWLEIVAILPFFMVFRVLDFITAPLQVADVGQDAAHLAEGARSGRFAELLRPAEASRSTRLSRFIRPLARSPRFARAVEFFRHPDEDGDTGE